MRYWGFVLLLSSTCVLADAAIDKFDPALFEKRFQNADKENKGKLTRDEAYAEFPRMPEFFDEIDRNKDGFITLDEVHNTMEQRVNAAMNATKQAARYGSVDGEKVDQTTILENTKQDPVFSSAAEERRYRRFQFYESIGADKSKSIERGEPIPPAPSSPIFVKPF